MRRSTIFPGFLTATLLLGTASAAAQTLPYPAANVVNSAGTYTSLGANGTVIGTGGNFDDANSAPQPIGFPFSYNGQVYTQFVLNTNGFLKLGTTPPAMPYFGDQAQGNPGGPVDNPAETNLLLPFNTDLTASAGAPAEYRVATSGAAPTRICTVEWRNVQDKASAGISSQLAAISFQMKLYEGSNQIEFVYGPALAGAGAAALRFVYVGLKGTGTGPLQLVSGGKNSGDPWSLTAFRQGSDTHNVRSTALPDAGRTYRFVAALAHDAAVQLYSYDQLAVPAGSPAPLRAVVTNVGVDPLTNLVLTLRVTGANTATVTRTVPALASATPAVVDFGSVALPVLGANLVTVSLAPDDNAANNEASQPLQTTANTFSYITPGVRNTAGVYGAAGVAEEGFAARFTLSTPQTVTAVRAFLGTVLNTATTKSTEGETVYGVVADRTTGLILARSPDYVVTAADLDTVHEFRLPTPAALPAGDFLAGLVQVVNQSRRVYPMGLQVEPLLRPNTFFTINGANAPVVFPPVDVAGAATGRFMLEAVVAAPLGTAAAPEPALLQVYPNPSQTGRFTLTRPRGAGPVSATILNVLGQAVFTLPACSETAPVLDLAHLPDGTYTLRLRQGREVICRQLVILR